MAIGHPLIGESGAFTAIPSPPYILQQSDQTFKGKVYFLLHYIHLTKFTLQVKILHRFLIIFYFNSSIFNHIFIYYIKYDGFL